VFVTSRNCRCFTTFAEIHGGQVIAHLARRITTTISIAESELAVFIFSPTFHGFVVKKCARVISSCRNCRCNTIFAEIHGGQVIAHLARLITTTIFIAESELAVPIVSPTFHGFVVKDCARVEGTSGNRRRH
jgi:hypothetical protein